VTKTKGIHPFFCGHVTGENQPLGGLRKSYAQVENFDIKIFFFSNVKIIN